ncbi:MAG TPA: hypothetical protein VIO34_04355 [Candidatus Dormibacteraeota bacterium]
MRSTRHFATVAGPVATAVVLLSVLAASSALGAETKAFTGEKSCGAPIVSISPPAPGGYCLITGSSYKILFGAKVYYTAAVVASGVLTSPVTLVATDERGSTATGQCTYHLPNLALNEPGHGLCEYSSGTGKLAGFHATIEVGPPIAGQRVYALMGTYWFDREEDEDSDSD